MSEAAPGDIIIGSGWQQGADGYAGIIVGHGRIVSNSSQGVQDNSSILELQRSHPEMAAFRYVGFWNYYRSKPLANEGFNPNEPRLPAGQPGGGQWTSGGTGGVQNWKGQLKMAPPTVGLSAGDQRTAFSARIRPGPITKTSDHPALNYTEAYLGDIAEVWKGYGDAITDTVTGLWNTVRHPIDTAKGVAKGVTQLVKDPVGVLKAIGQQVAADFTSGDPRKAGKLVGQVLIALAGTEVSAEKLAALLPKVEAAAAGKVVSFTAEETGILEKAMSAEQTVASKEPGLIRGEQTSKDVADAARAKPPLRQAYETDVKALQDQADSARAAGQEPETAARMLHAERNALKVKYRELSPPDKVKVYEQRNINKYGNPLGPTIEQLRAQGKTWEQIIESATRPGGEDLGY